MAGPHLENLEHEDPAPSITSRHPEGPEEDHKSKLDGDDAAGTGGTGGTGTLTAGTRASSRRWLAVDALTPPILALLFALAAVALVFFFSSRQNLPSIFSSSDSSSPYSTPTPDYLLPVSSDSTQANTMSTTEQTFIAIKPDGVQRGLIGPIISRFENRGFKLVAMKLVAPDEKHLRAHYADLDTEKNAKWFIPMINYMKDQPMCAMVWEGRDAVKTGRAILGATDPLASAPGTIRGDYALDKGRNICHGSDSVENAQKEIALWFEKSQLLSWTHSQAHYFMEL
ncbi:hypothetical protein E4U43_001458 [Claviceps pusilla]|uniref:Nucleoside diphosphate kinase n=1 Tax=Claviceps pusilla TaxID=123648 RepID=A0A9P7NA64_9HYPO|nr:hypothetical protein E4U43_001458 [Claviceps pusilla]